MVAFRTHTNPLLIAEAGLHGNGLLSYYMELLNKIAGFSTGWPPIAIKTQYWLDKYSPWALKVKAANKRMPLNCLSLSDLLQFANACDSLGIGFGVTIHDTFAANMLENVLEEGKGQGISFIKLGSFGAGDKALRKAVWDIPLPLVLSMPSLNRSTSLLHTNPTRAHPTNTIECYSAYPANKPWEGTRTGYSCHSVPELAMGHALAAAAAGASIIEIHVSTRSCLTRPQPADYCVSMHLDQFSMLVHELGTKWSAI